MMTLVLNYPQKYYQLQNSFWVLVTKLRYKMNYMPLTMNKVVYFYFNWDSLYSCYCKLRTNLFKNWLEPKEGALYKLNIELDA
jgi:hypothetical protein